MKLFPTEKIHSFETWWKRIFFNYFPAYRRTGGNVKFISSDWKEIHVQLKLSRKTRNYVGTVFGGSIYGSVDPIYMMQLICILSHDYVIWDKEAQIKFKKPIRGTVKACFIVTDELISHIVEQVKLENKCVVDIPVNFVDDSGAVYAEINKTMYIADKKYYDNRGKN